MWQIHRFSALLTAVLFVASCNPHQPDPTEPTKQPTAGRSAMMTCGTSNPPWTEGEIIGALYDGGALSCDEQTVTLSYINELGITSRLHVATFRATLESDSDYPVHWDFWDPIDGGACSNVDEVAIEDQLEEFHAEGASGEPAGHSENEPAEQEGHCVRPGHYQFTEGHASGRSFKVDYLHKMNLTIPRSGGGQYWIERDPSEYASNNYPSYTDAIDLVIHRDIGTQCTSSCGTPVLTIQNASSNQYNTSLAFVNTSGTVTGYPGDWFRFAVDSSTWGWSGDSRGQSLARLYFNGTNLAQSTNYYDPTGGAQGMVLRAYRYTTNPTAEYSDYTVGLELMRPDEPDKDTPDVTRTIRINRRKPDLRPSAVSANSSVEVGGALGVNITVRNDSTNSYAVAESSWQYKVYLSTDATLSLGSDVDLSPSTTLNGIAVNPNSQISRTPSLNVPGGTAAGTYYVIVSLDPSSAVLEGNESNNVGASSSITVSAGAEPPPAPTGLDADDVTSNSATLTWTNGTSASGTTTRVDTMPNGGSWGPVATSLAAGVASYGVSGLTPSTSYSVRVRHTKDGLDSDWLTSSSLFTTSAVESPSNLASDDETSSGATVSWTNGISVSGTTTSVEYSANGTNWTTAHASLTAGVSSASLSGLAAATTYDIRVRHTYQSQQSSGTTAADLVTTTSGPPSVLTFEVTGACDRRWYANKWRIDWPVSWTVSGSTSGFSWWINDSDTDDVGTSQAFATGSSGLSTTLTGIEGESGVRYFWIRYGTSGTWEPLDPATLDMGSCDLE